MIDLRRLLSPAVLVPVLLLGVAAPSIAQVSKTPTAAPSGTYNLDERHASVIARVAHGGGSSLSTFRFNRVTGSLDWNATAPAQSRVTVNVDVASIDTPVAGFAEELIGERFLKVTANPTARFVSTAIRTTGPTTGVITGDFTFNGVTKPLAVNASLVGAGNGQRGAKVVGFTGTAKFNRADYGFNALLGPIGNEVELLLDIEFNQPGAAPAPAPAPAR